MAYDYDDSQGAAHHAEELNRQHDEINIIAAIRIYERLVTKAVSAKVRNKSKRKISRLNTKYVQLTGKNYRRES